MARRLTLAHVASRANVEDNLLHLCQIHHESLDVSPTTEVGRGDVEALASDDYRAAFEEAGRGRIVDLDPNNL